MPFMSDDNASGSGPQTAGLATGSLVLGILSLVFSLACLGILLGPAAVIMGFISYRRSKTFGGGDTDRRQRQRDASVAAWGLALGICGFGVSVAWLIRILTPPGLCGVIYC